jgi:hypothetical protein
MHCCLLSVLLCLPACLQGWVHLLHLLLARIALALLLLLAAGLLLSLLASRRRHLLLALVPVCRTEVEEQMVEQMVRLGSTASAQPRQGRLSADRANIRFLLAEM